MVMGWVGLGGGVEFALTSTVLDLMQQKSWMEGPGGGAITIPVPLLAAPPSLQQRVQFLHHHDHPLHLELPRGLRRGLHHELHHGLQMGLHGQLTVRGRIRQDGDPQNGSIHLPDARDLPFVTDPFPTRGIYEVMPQDELHQMRARGGEKDAL
ncbi:hypothetical protein BDK51DRAFT_31132 [Blyttiomyces helicus]|uniref:Uncharacterized protein n=1 Tax=Blyttiomyces helicus TaxID=388810 RepID=A0A4P9WDF8_9FUNG|nr:hypothetical protein BDK51DRAFT_31132 [Blyttiomyces helicus]|eukprot:RKO90382.1 hypothetical protein BDK51DRAFT_31132 [Blyttiomyces helicus]